MAALEAFFGAVLLFMRPQHSGWAAWGICGPEKRARNGHRGASSDALAVLKVLAGFPVGFRPVLGAATGFRGFRKSFRTGFRHGF